jgi:hypothetical protein
MLSAWLVPFSGGKNYLEESERNAFIYFDSRRARNVRLRADGL